MDKMDYIKDFKVRMEQVKCEKYKTFQPELPTKKFLFSDERESIHNMKLLRDDSSDQNKATIIHNESEPVKEEPEPEEEEEVIKATTGMFRDEERRIDLVLVVEDGDDEPINDIKMDFLAHILRAGLEFEIEPGVMEDHQNLTFIKIHAPYPILEKYGKFYGTKRYFADTRYDYIGKTKKKKTKTREKEWVMLVRNNYETPKEYSNYERSIIVYKILLHLPFGDNSNYYGIERLLNRRVIVDVFALHDGPYFIIPDQTISGSNARQILNYYWSRIRNIFHKQPIHLIHEYFGPRIAFYFAFYEFFTNFLKVAAFLGILNIILGTLNLTILEEAVKNSVCKSNIKLCKSCKHIKICPERLVKEYCLSIKINLILDHLLTPLYSIMTVIGALIFVRLWQRREYFLKWIWEVGRHDSYYKNAVRPLFDLGFGVRTDPFMGGLKYNAGIIPILLRNVVSKGLVLFYWYSVPIIMYNTYGIYEAFCKDMHTNQKYEKYRDYIVMCMFQTFHTLFMTVFDRIYSYIVYFLVKLENHSSYKKFSESIIIKKMGVKMVFQYAFIVYYTFLHGLQPRYRRCFVEGISTHATLRFLSSVFYGYKDKDICDNLKYCFPYSCIIEVGTLLATLLIVTKVIYRMSGYIFSLKTDYNQIIYSNSDIPCWEREYRLGSWTEEDMIQKYINIAAQFCLVTWFVIAFPLAPLILYLINIWDIRHEARKLLLASRKPLLIKTPGTEMIKVLYFIAFIAIITNGTAIGTITRTGLRYVMAKLNKKPEELLNFSTFNYNLEYKCYAPDIISPNKKVYFFDIHGRQIFFRVDHFMVLLFGMYYFILFVFAMGFVIFIIRYMIPLQREVKEARATEEKVRSLYHYYEYEYNDSKHK